MKVSNIKILFLLVCIVSCTSEPDTDSIKRIKDFESVLGKQETTYLNEIVSDFDKFLESNYQGSTKEQFQLYLRDIGQYSDVDYFIIDSIKRLEYKDSKLFTKFIYDFPDSVWVDEGTIKYKYPGFSKDEYLIAIKQKGLSKGDLIEEIKNEPIQRVITPSNFYFALEKICSQDSLIMDYLDTKEGIGNISPAILAGGLNYHIDNSSVYFAKRILIMDLFDGL